MELEPQMEQPMEPAMEVPNGSAKPDLEGGMQDMSPRNESISTELSEIPSLTIGGGVVIVFLYILVIVVMGAILWWLKRKGEQKQRDIEASRDRYSRVINARQAPHQQRNDPPRATYNRGADNVLLINGAGAGGGQYTEEDQDGGDISDSYEDMAPVVPRKASNGASPSRGGYNGGGNNGNGNPRNLPQLRDSPARDSPPRGASANSRYPPRR